METRCYRLTTTANYPAMERWSDRHCVGDIFQRARQLIAANHLVCISRCDYHGTKPDRASARVLFTNYEPGA